MALQAMCMPILPGKKDKWLEMMKQVNEGEAGKEFRASRESAGVHERSFLQETPHGDFVILTFEGDNPAESFAKIMSETGEDFAAFAKDVHGLDMTGPAPEMPTLVFDSRS